MRTLAFMFGVVAWLACIGSGQESAQPDWPQFGGPTRDFQYPETNIRPWPASGPVEVWRRPLGEGYSGVAAVGGALYTMYRRGDDEVVVAIDADTGTTIWEHAYPAPFLDGMNVEQGPGPHATPLVHRGRVYAAGATGRLHALDARTGAPVWQHRLIEDLGGTVVMRGYSSSPLAHGDLVIAQIGGDGTAVTAFDAAGGRVVWRGGSFENVSSSPILTRVGGRTEVAALGSGEVIGLDASTGATRWTHPHPHRWGENIPMPLWLDGLLFVTSYADGGSRVLSLAPGADGTDIRELWHHTRLRVYYTNVVRVGDRLYGSSGDLGPTVFTAVDVRTGEVAWQTRDVGRSNFVAIGSRLLLRDDEGRLVLASVGADGVTIHASAELLGAGPPTGPTIVGTRVFLRDRQVMMAVDLQ